MGLTKERVIRFRATVEQEARLRAAAGLAGETLTDFTLLPAMQRADEILGAGTVIPVPAEEYAAMLRMLEEPPKRIPALESLASQPRIFARA